MWNQEGQQQRYGRGVYPVKVALYARVSTSEDRQDPENQLRRLREFASARGFEVVEEYVDRASGVDPNRPALTEMMEAARKGTVGAVAIVRLDRIMRSTINLLRVLEEMEAWGVHLICLDQPIDTSTPSGRLLTTIIGAVATFERELISERVRDGMARAKANGKHVGRPLCRIDMDQALRLLEEGLSKTEVARTVGVPRSTLLTRLSKVLK
jgi:DNA invertase Pin-like site-specific DNA recombinase